MWSAAMGAVAAVVLGQPLTPVPYTDVTFADGFWADRLAVVRDATARANFHQCEITGRIDNLAIAAGKKEGAYQGYFFNDSDVYKAIEGAAYVMATLDDRDKRAEMDAYLDGLIATIAAAQRPDGYINSYFSTKPADHKDADTVWSNTADKHEMYCMGHLIEAGVAHYRVTGKRTLLDVAVKAADHIDSVFGPPPKRPDVCGHEEIELALIKLWRLGQADPRAGIAAPEKYRTLAEHFVNTRGVPAGGRTLYGEYCQDHTPLRDQTEVVGHAVRAMYLHCAAADLALYAGDTTVREPLERLWEDLTGRKMYVTGGIGNSGHNEGFTKPYDLPNDTAYAETCATIGLVLWAHRMNLLTGEAEYFNVLERALYNGVLSGLSLDGSKFFYENPLGSTGDHHRQDWYACACCPPNILRVLASVGGMAYATKGNEIYVNLFGAGRANVSLPEGSVELVQETRYPWDGRVSIRIGAVRDDREIRFRIRVPSWADETTVKAVGNGHDPQAGFPPALQDWEGGYIPVVGRWRTGDVIRVDISMPARRVHAHPSVTFDRGRAALQRGPIVYCLEDADNPGTARSIALPPDSKIEAEFRSDLLDGVTILSGEGLLMTPQDWEEGELYRSAPDAARVRFRAVPYFAWGNREAGGMQVWIPEAASLAPLGPRRGVTPTASHCWGPDSVAAITDRQEPASSADHQVPRQTFWPHRGTSEWVRLDFASPRRLTGLDVYWFDDGPPGGGGGCRVPASWSIEYRAASDGDWLPVANPRGLTVERDRYNAARFDPVTASAVRVTVHLQERYSAGLLEMRPVP